MKKVDLPALRAAIATLRAHESLIRDSMDDLQSGDPVEIENLVSAIAHVVDDDFRSLAEPAGS